MKLTSTQKTALWAALAVVAVGIAALALWIVQSKRKNGGLVVIGNVTGDDAGTQSSGGTILNTENNSSVMNQNNNTGSSPQTHFNDTSLPRGYRNNNPLNIRKNAANAWKGKVVPGTDSAFEQFISMPYGYRAALYLIRKYIGQGNNTIRKIVTKWAPPSENNTSSYVSNVAKRSGINADAVLSRTDMDSLCKIAYAMAWSENGKAPASMDDIYKGWSLL